MIVNGYTIEPFANLSDADLTGVNLAGVNLAGADLTGADLSGADLSGANLQKASLSGAILRGTNMAGATLVEANLTGADVQDADLTGADLRCASLTYAVLQGANLSDANLSDADLYYADLYDADLTGTTLPASLDIPQGELVGWKKAACGGIVGLIIPADARRSRALSNKMRTDRAVVVSAPEGAVSIHDPSFRYVEGETVVSVNGWGEDRWDECAPGIHFFLTREEAEAY